jgi:hypothetical protein
MSGSVAIACLAFAAPCSTLAVFKDMASVRAGPVATTKAAVVRRPDLGHQGRLSGSSRGATAASITTACAASAVVAAPRGRVGLCEQVRAFWIAEPSGW